VHNVRWAGSSKELLSGEGDNARPVEPCFQRVKIPAGRRGLPMRYAGYMCIMGVRYFTACKQLWGSGLSGYGQPYVHGPGLSKLGLSWCKVV